MSYSFNTRGANAAELKSNVAAQLDKVVEQQPIHAADRNVAEDAAGALIDVLRDPNENEDILANVSGSCYGDQGKKLNGASVNVSVSFAPKS